jgi:hypothetical protein
MQADVPYDALTTLLVFMVGIPAVVLQSLAPEVRLVVARRWARLLLDVGLPVALSLGIITLAMVAEVRGSAIDWTWPAVLAALFAIVGFTAFRIPRSYGRRDAVVRSLAREISGPVAAKGLLAGASLYDLIELGKQSAPGREKEWVLSALMDLTDAVCHHPLYNGDRLDDLVLGVVDILPSEMTTGGLQNYATATGILRVIVARTPPPHTPSFKQVDLIRAIRALSTIGRVALTSRSEDVPLGVVQVLGSVPSGRAESFASQALFEVGIVAIERDQMLIAMAALDNLMTLVELHRPAGGELVADTLGLLAHFFSDGETAHTYASVRLERLRDDLEENLTDAIERAAEHCARTTQFRTADRVQRMGRELEALTRV